MAYISKALKVFIASPSDVGEARDAIERSLTRWNGVRGESSGVTLVPIRYEAHAVPSMAGRGQAVINDQLLSEADIVIAVFGNSLGSASGEALSGTVEEIQEANARQIPVHVFFSSAPVPQDRMDDMQRLRSFKDSFEGLYKEYSDIGELTDAVGTAVESDVRNIDPPQADAASKGAVPGAIVRREMETKYSPKGQPKSVTRRWIDVTNSGMAPAENFRIEGLDSEVVLFDDQFQGRTLHSDDVWPIHFELSMGSPSFLDVTMTWEEDGEKKEKHRLLNLRG